MSKFQKDYTQGSVVKQLISFSLPFLFSNLLQALYSVVDMVVVGQYVGPVGVSGVQIGGQVTMLITNIVTGFVVGATVLVAQDQGAKKQRRPKKDHKYAVYLFRLCERRADGSHDFAQCADFAAARHRRYFL